MRADAKRESVKTKTYLSVNPTKVDPDKQCPLNMRHTETFVVHNFPALLPFGNTVLKLRNGQWNIKCGFIRQEGYGGEVDEIVKHFVNYATKEMQNVNMIVEKDEFTTEPTSPTL